MTDRDRLIELLGLRLPINVRNVLGSYDTIGERTLAVDEREKLADYLLANGVILPPCKVGDVVYSLMGGFVEDMKVNRVLLSLKPNEQHPIDYIKDLDDIGKTVFLTKEDAEEKLKELGK